MCVSRGRRRKVVASGGVLFGWLLGEHHVCRAFWFRERERAHIVMWQYVIIILFLIFFLDFNL
jgi:hypothetical protein